MRRLASVKEHADLLLDPISVSQSISLGQHPDSAIDNVRRLYERHDNEDAAPPIYSEMLKLQYDGKIRSWHEASRWIKYEQVVEGGGTRFSKPHITLLSFQGLLQARNCLRRGVVVLDSTRESLSSVFDDIIRLWEDRALVNDTNIKGIRKALWAPKVHMTISKSRRNSLDQASDSDDEAEEDGKERENQETHTHNDTNHLTIDTGNATGDLSQSEKRLVSKLPNNTESCAILVGHVASLEHPTCAFIRLKTAQNFYPEIPDIPVRTKFIFVLLTPKDNYENEAVMIGRTVGALLSDEVFRRVAEHTQEPYTMADAIEEFMSNMVVIPPGKCTTETRWEPKDGGTEEVRLGHMNKHKVSLEGSSTDGDSHAVGLHRTGRTFGGLAADIKAKLPYYVSDYTDFFRGRFSQSLAATVFLFFANLTSIITFGAVMGVKLHHEMATIEAILCGGICGVIFAMFSVGIWIFIMLMILTATDASALVGLITRFTEDAFATLISVVFIIQAFEKLIGIGATEAKKSAAKMAALQASGCKCFVGNSTEDSLIAGFFQNDTREGACDLGEFRELDNQIDVYQLSIILTFGTFALTYAFKEFRKSPFFSSNIRNAVSDFGVLIAIVVMTAYSHYVGEDKVPTLNIPDSFRPTKDRSWLVLPVDVPLHLILIAILPAAFYTILIVMDQQITAVIVNRKDNLLKKGYGYHLDLLVIAILVLICSFLGLPFFVAATVLSVMHVDSLRVQSESAAPGEKAQMLGVKEQRLTAILAHLMIGVSVFLTPVIKLVPMPVLIGVFLYMGVVSLIHQQFVQRVALWFMPVKHQPDYTWLRCVKMRRVHLFTLIQMLSLIGLFVVKYSPVVKMAFPLMLIIMVLIRMMSLEKVFTHSELKSLDDILPSFKEVMFPKNRGKLSINQYEKVNQDPEALLIKESR
ncbi:unnamed protein product, partial [Mesorhabditis spiculigera]